MHINSTCNTPGRLCNIIILNILCSSLAKKYNLRFDYRWLELSNDLGLSLFTEGTRVFDGGVITFEDNDFERFIERDELNSNVFVNKHHQTPSCAHQIKNYILKPDIKESIINHNKFKDRYGNNNDVYVHVRLDDAIRFNPGYDYYDAVLSNLTFDKGYISSDTISHPICCDLIAKYNLEVVDFSVAADATPTDGGPSYNEILTLMFASTCKHIVCSGGTFSWVIGALSFVGGSNVYYHSSNRSREWFGDIFVFDEWTQHG